MINNIIIFPKNKIEQEEKNIVNKKAIDKQYKELLQQQKEILKRLLLLVKLKMNWQSLKRTWHLCMLLKMMLKMI